MRWSGGRRLSWPVFGGEPVRLWMRWSAGEAAELAALEGEPVEVVDAVERGRRLS